MAHAADYNLSVAAERILKAAARVGHFMPSTKSDMRIAQSLRSREFLDLSDNVPGSFEITSEGEHVLSQLETV